MSHYKWMIVDWCALHAVKRHIRIESDWFNSKSECLKDYKEKNERRLRYRRLLGLEGFLVEQKLLK